MLPFFVFPDSSFAGLSASPNTLCRAFCNATIKRYVIIFYDVCIYTDACSRHLGYASKSTEDQNLVSSMSTALTTR
jgi:hypothetical protein